MAKNKRRKRKSLNKIMEELKSYNYSVEANKAMAFNMLKNKRSDIIKSKKKNKKRERRKNKIRPYKIQAV